LSLHSVSGCFYLDSCIVLSEILGRNKARMDKLRNDVENYNIDCYIPQSVIDECEKKIKDTIDFLGNILRNVIVVYLEGVRTKERDLSSTKPSNEDLHILEKAFLTISQTIRQFDLITDPFQAVEEWVVEKLDKEIANPTEISLNDFIRRLTAIILREINKLKSDFERLVELEADYISKSNLAPDPKIVNDLVNIGIHKPDADHISTIESHRKNRGTYAVFLTFDYRTIILNRFRIERVSAIICCDPIYGLSYLRKCR